MNVMKLQEESVLFKFLSKPENTRRATKR